MLIRKKSHSLSRLQTPNLTSYGKLSTSASMLDVRQAGTDMNATEWHPQEFTDLHPHFQKKAIKIATKAIRKIANCKKSKDRATPRSPTYPGQGKRNAFFSKNNVCMNIATQTWTICRNNWQPYQIRLKLKTTTERKIRIHFATNDLVLQDLNSVKLCV